MAQPLRLPELLYGKASRVEAAADRLAWRWAQSLLANGAPVDPPLVPVKRGTVLCTGDVGEPIDLWHLTVITELIARTSSGAYELATEQGSESEEAFALSESVAARVTELLFERTWGALGIAVNLPCCDAQTFARRVECALAHVDAFAGYAFQGHPDGLGFTPTRDYEGMIEVHLLRELQGWEDDRGGGVQGRLRRAIDRMRAAPTGEARRVLAECIERTQRDESALDGKMPAGVSRAALQELLTRVPAHLIERHKVGHIPDCIDLANAIWPDYDEP